MVVPTLVVEFRKVKTLADRAIAQLDDGQLHRCLDADANSVAVLMQHMAGNMRSRWTDFLDTDGEKPWRNRDAEFDAPSGTRTELIASWEHGWTTLFDTLGTLGDGDLARQVTIRGEVLTVLAAIARQLAHYGGHAHQIVMLAKHLQGASWQVLSVPRASQRAGQRP